MVIRLLTVCPSLNGIHLSLPASILSDVLSHHRPKATGPGYHARKPLTLDVLGNFDAAIES